VGSAVAKLSLAVAQPLQFAETKAHDGVLANVNATQLPKMAVLIFLIAVSSRYKK
jgi:hypothetical protein